MMEVRIVEDEAELEALHEAAEANDHAGASCSLEQPHHPRLDRLFDLAASKHRDVIAVYDDGEPCLYILVAERGEIVWMCILKDGQAAQAMHDATEAVVKKIGRCYGFISNDQLRSELAASESFGSVIDIDGILVTCVPDRYKGIA